MGKLTFIEPLKSYIKISSYYGKRTDPNTGEEEVQHGGIDYVVDIGKDVLASERGKVVKAGFNGSKDKMLYGNVIIIEHTPKAEKNEPHLYTLYAHLREKKGAKGPFAVKAGDTVEQGQIIGYSGSTGKSTGPHLHFGVAHLGKKAKWMSPGDGATGIDPSVYSDPNKYICQTHKLNGTLNDLTDKEAERLINDRISYQLVEKFRMAVLVDGEVKGHIDAKNKSVTVKLKYDEKELIKLMASPIQPPKKSAPLDINISVKL